MSDERVKRPPASRTQPIRNFANIFGPGGAGARFPFGGPIPGAAASGSAPETGDGDPPAGDPISRGVDLGYRVIDAYMREGQKAARRIWEPYAGSAAPGADVQHRLTAMFRQTADLAAMWFDLSGALGVPGIGGTERPGSTVAGPFSSGKQPEAPPAEAEAVPVPASVADEGAMVLSVELISSQAAEVSIDLRPRSSGVPLRVHDLRDVDSEKPRIQGATVVATSEGVKVRVQVSAGHPPGTYTGVILDERTSLPRGVLSVRIREPG